MGYMLELKKRMMYHSLRIFQIFTCQYSVLKSSVQMDIRYKKWLKYSSERDLQLARDWIEEFERTCCLPLY